jgi:hypothetical protein
LAALLAVAGFAWFIGVITTPTPVMWENFRRLRLGMSSSEVEALLGEPIKKDQYVRASDVLVNGKVKHIVGTQALWVNDEILISLRIDQGGLYTGEAIDQRDKRHREYVPLPLCFHDRVRRGVAGDANKRNLATPID